jgi:hypothetical protein
MSRWVDSWVDYRVYPSDSIFWFKVQVLSLGYPYCLALVTRTSLNDITPMGEDARF